MTINTKESKIIFSAIDRVSNVANNIANGLTPLQNKIDKIGSGFRDFGAGLATKSMIGLTGVLLGFAKPAMQFEKSMAQVFKTFDPQKIATTESAFSKTVMNMSSGMGVMAKDMAQIFENMPLPEIMNIESLSDKSKYKAMIDMAKITAMSVTTMGLGAADAGDKVKQLFNLMGGKDANKAIEIMDSVNEIGNQFGVKAADNLEFLTRQGALAVGIAAKLSGLEIASIGGAFMSLGASPDTAGTSFKKLVTVGQAYTSATKGQKSGFEKLGTSAKMFAEYWQKTPTDAIIDLLDRAKGLDDIKITPVFKELFGVEGSNNIKAMMLQVDSLVKKIKVGTDKDLIKDSVFKEFVKLSKTSSFAADKLKSSFNNMGIIIGNSLLPHITKLSDYTSKLLGKYNDLDQGTKDFIGSTLIGTTGMLGLGVAIGGVTYAIGGLLGGFKALSRGYGILSAVGMMPAKGLSGVMGGISKFKRVKGPSLSDGLIGANDNARKLTAWGKFSNIIDKIGNSKGGKLLSSLGTVLGGGAMATIAFGFTTAAIAAGALLALGGGIYSRWSQIVKKLTETKNLFGVLLGGEANISGMKKLGNSISQYIGDALVGVLWTINRTIEGFIVMKNMISGMSIDEANSNMLYKMSKFDPKQQKEFDANIIPSVNESKRGELRDMYARFKYNQPQKLPDIKVENVITVHKDGSVSTETKSKNIKTGDTSVTKENKKFDIKNEQSRIIHMRGSVR